MGPAGLALLTLVSQLAASVAVGCHRGYLGHGAAIGAEPDSVFLLDLPLSYPAECAMRSVAELEDEVCVRFLLRSATRNSLRSHWVAVYSKQYTNQSTVGSSS